MSDRELLELAAKAAGYSVRYVSDGRGGGSFYMGPDQLWWDALTDDGDALRLAVKLRLTIRLSDPDAVLAGINTSQSGAPTLDGIGPWFWKEWNADGGAEAATRRAIVRAAAEIGKAMP